MTVMALIAFTPPTQAQYVPDTTALNAFIDSMKVQDSTRIALRDSLAQVYNLPVLDTTGGNHRALWEFQDTVAVYVSIINSAAAEAVKTNMLYPSGYLGLNLTGSGIKVGVWDSGEPYLNNQEISGRVNYNDPIPGSPDHSTFIIGTIAAAGNDPDVRGMAYQTTVDAWEFGVLSDIDEMAVAARMGLLLSNHSYAVEAGWLWGSSSQTPCGHWRGDPAVSATEDYKFGYYSDRAAAWDRIAFLAPFYTIVTGTGNWRNVEGNTNCGYDANGAATNGYDQIAGHAVAKNVITVGGVEINQIHSGITGVTSASLWEFSNVGPTDDGRIKPDIVAPVTVTSLDGPYGTKVETGTSISTAVVTGSIALLQEHAMNINDGKPIRASTMKALVIASASDLGPTGPDYEYGWGLLNTAYAASTLSKEGKLGRNLHVFDSIAIPQNSSVEIPIYKGSDDCPLKVTICWTDPEAIPYETTPFSSSMLNRTQTNLVYDFNVTVTGPGNVYYPWVLGGLADPSEPATTGENTVDNVEQVLIDNSTPGWYTVTITSIDRPNPPVVSMIVLGNSKPHLMTEIEEATGPNSQRKVDYLTIYNDDYWQAVYEDMGEIWYIESTDQGTTWNNEIRISSGQGTASRPSIFSTDEKAAVTWYENDDIRFAFVFADQIPDSCHSYREFVQLHHASMIPYTDFLQVSEYSAVSTNQPPADYASPVVASTGTYTLVVYETLIGGSPPDGHLAYMWFDGLTLANFGLVSGATPSQSTPPITPTLAFDKYKPFYNDQPEFHLAWREGDEILYSKLKINGTNPLSFYYLQSAEMVNSDHTNLPAVGPPSISPYFQEEAASYPTNPTDAVLAYSISDQSGSPIPGIEIAWKDSAGATPFSVWENFIVSQNEDANSPSVMSVFREEVYDPDNIDVAYDFTDSNGDPSIRVHSSPTGGSWDDNQQATDVLHPTVMAYPKPNKRLELYLIPPSSQGDPYQIASTTTGLRAKQSFVATSRLPRSGFLLGQNYPNPFSTSTEIPFTLSDPTYVRLSVHDLLGRKVRQLVDGFCEKGAHSARFTNSDLPPGTYQYLLRTESETIHRYFTILR